MELELCLKCGEKKVEPMYEVDISVGILTDYGLLICDDCVRDMTDEEINELIKDKDKLPF